MGNPYNSQSISGYNSSPPPDDASQVAANQVSWSKHKTKLGDPLKTLAEGINSEVSTAFGKLPWYAVRSISSSDSVVADDERKLLSCTNSITITLIAAATAGAGFTVTIFNAGTGTVTIDGDGSETINGTTTTLLQKQYDAVHLQSNGSNWIILVDARTSYEVAINEAKGADIASAATTDIGAATGNYVDVTGTTTITALGTVQAGSEREVQFDGALTLTHNASSLILPGGADITTAAGDVARFRSLGSGNWICTGYTRATGTALIGGATVVTPTATTSGTSVDVTGISSDAKEITITFLGISTSGTSPAIIQLGDSGGIEATGYSGHQGRMLAATVASGAWGGAGVVITSNPDATHIYTGTCVLTLHDESANTWVANVQMGATNGAQLVFSAGQKSLTGTLDRFRLTTLGGTDTFDAGAIGYVVKT